MTYPFTWRSERSSARFLLRMVVLGLAMSFAGACYVPGVTPTVPLPEVEMTRIEGQPFEGTLPKLHPTWRDYLDVFAASVPSQLPELAFPSWTQFNPTLPMPNRGEGPILIELADGYAELEIGAANPGSITTDENLLCMHNNIQVGCTPEVDGWQIYLPPETLAFIPIRIQAGPEDRLVFLFMVGRDDERAIPASGDAWVYVEQQPSASPPTWTDAPQHRPIFGGCDFAVFIKDPSDTDLMNANFHSGVQRDSVFYLLIQLCNPTGQEYVQLVPIANRTTVVDLPGDLWHTPVRLASAASVIPVNISQFDQVHELQVAVIPLSEDAVRPLRRFNFTQAVRFLD